MDVLGRRDQFSGREEPDARAAPNRLATADKALVHAVADEVDGSLVIERIDDALGGEVGIGVDD